jgi:PX domain-containing protein kinase-like protein
MDTILTNILLANSLPVKKFLDEENYLENFKELALAHVSMFFRSESSWQIIEPLNEIGQCLCILPFVLSFSLVG